MPSDLVAIPVEVSPVFKRHLRALSKKYHRIRKIISEGM